MSRWKAAWHNPKLAFYRDTLLLLAATIGGGMLSSVMNLVVSNFVSKGKAGEFATFVALRDALGQLTIPVVGMQTAFAQLAARHTGPDAPGILSGALRSQIRVLTAYWGLLAVGCLLFQSDLVERFHLGDPVKLWLALGAGWLMLITPAFFGVIQGKQEFHWYALAKLGSDAGIFAGTSLVVFAFRPDATGAIAGLALGMVAGFSVSWYLTRRDWLAKAVPFRLSDLMRSFVPLTAGIGVINYMFTSDSIRVQEYFIDGKDGYSAARTIGRTVVFLVAPVTLAMFPSIARSAARSEKSNVLGQALAATGIVGCAAALLCSIAPGFLLKILFPGQDHSASAHLVPMFAWAFLPLAISSVLLNSLLAQARYGVVPCMILIPISYTLVLKRWHPSLESVIGVTGGHAALLLLIMIVFTLRPSPPARHAH